SDVSDSTRRTSFGVNFASEPEVLPTPLDPVMEALQDPKLIATANQVVVDIIFRAKEQAMDKITDKKQVPHDLTSDPRLLEMARIFVNDILLHAKEEACDHIRKTNINNNN
ncbi:unnamed protein product, partial [Meganyctiphanes norvegica]